MCNSHAVSSQKFFNDFYKWLCIKGIGKHMNSHYILARGDCREQLCSYTYDVTKIITSEKKTRHIP